MRRLATPLSLRGRSLVRIGLLGPLSLLLVALTCDTEVERQSGSRTFTVVYCADVGGGIVLCVPYEVTWQTRFWGNGHHHNADSTADYFYHLHHWQQWLAIEGFYNDTPPDLSYPFGFNTAMSNHVYSFSLGDLGLLPADDDCGVNLVPGDWLFWCVAWHGAINLGNPGGYGDYRAGVQAVGVLPLPLPNDGVDYPWYMYHVK